MLYLGTTKDDDIQSFDGALSIVSENAVQNKVVTKKLNELEAKINSVQANVNNTITKLQDELDLFKTGLLKQIEQDMAKMAKADGSNLKYPHILEMGSGKTSDGKVVYYRKYSDGWCEQWGIANGINIGVGTTVLLYFQYTNTNYISITSGTHSTASDDPLWIYDKTVSSFKIYHCSGGNIDGTLIAYPHWYTAGYVV